jgi:hypothetical protein
MTRLPQTSGKRPGKQIRKSIRLRGSKRIRDADASCSGFTCSPEVVGYDSFGALPMAEAAARPLRPAFWCFPPASPVLPKSAGKQKTGLKARSKTLIFIRKFGAGEGIRTLDPNLGKVVLLCASVDFACFFVATIAHNRILFWGFRCQWHRKLHLGCAESV